MENESLLKITVVPNGPIGIQGMAEITLADGTTVERENPFLCRCGASNHKPFCDGSHTKIGFKD